MQTAFENARRNRTALMPWRNLASDKPVTVTIWLAVPSVASTGEWKHPDAELTAFWMLQPAHSYASLLKSAELRYPKSNRKNHAEGSVTLRFVVDSSGSAEPTTIHDIRSAGEASRSGLTADEYADFRDATRAWVVKNAYSPERVAGCAIESVVEQPVKFLF